MTGMIGMAGRRGVLAGAAALLAAPRLGRAQGLTKVRITQPADSLSYMPIYVGRARRMFEAAGIDLEVVITRGDGPDVQALMAREVQFVATPPHHLYTLHLQGRQLRGICGILGRCGINLVIAKQAAAERNINENSPIEAKLAALKGLTIGASAPGSLTFNLAQYYILRAGLDPQRDARVVASGTGAAALAALRNGIVNAYSFSSPLTDQMVQTGAADWLINNTRGQDPVLSEFLHAVIYVRPDYARENADLVRRMVRTIVEASAWIKSNPVEQVATTIRPFFSRLDEAVFLSALGNVREAVTPDGKMSPAGSNAYQEVLIRTGHLRQRVPFEAVFDTSFLPG